MTKPIKIGQIGVGHGHAAGKMDVYRQSPDFEVVGIIEPDPRLREEAKSSPTYAGLPWLSQEELFAVPGLQAVAVETEVKHLLDVAQACVDAGFHIHLDKPAGSDLSKFQRVLDTAAAKHLAVQMGYMYRYNPAVVLLRQFLANGWLGDIFELHAVMSKVVPAQERKPLAQYPGGIMFELGCHLIDLVIAILGRPEKVHAFTQHASSLDDGLADNQLAVLTYPKAIASVKSSALEVDGFSRRHLVVCGTKGTFHIQPLDAPTVRFSLAERAGEYAKGAHEITFGPYKRYVADAADFALIIRNQKDNDYSCNHDLLVQKTVLLASNNI